MKLELKHLAPYLPYGLKGKRDGYNKGILMQGLDYSENVLTNFGYIDIKYFNPILRPLSDLTKEIALENGKKIIVINTFFRESRDLLEKELRITNGNLIIDFLSWVIIQKLLEFHFDVFGLIKNGLAIDINTLNK